MAEVLGGKILGTVAATRAQNISECTSKESPHAIHRYDGMNDLCNQT